MVWPPLKTFLGAKQKPKIKLDFDEFMALPIRMFLYIGIQLKQKKITKSIKIIGILNLVNTIFIFTHLLDFFATSQNPVERAECVGYINYFLVGLGKIFAIIYYRPELLQSLTEFNELYPCVPNIRRYKLERYMRQYKLIERFLHFMFWVVTCVYHYQPLVLSLYEWAKYGAFTYHTHLYARFPLPMQQAPWLYPLYFTSITFSSYTISIVILSCDLYMYGCIMQLSMNLKLLALQILELQPQNPESLEQLKAIAVRHEKLRKLKRDINRIFVPSILFSLMSSSFILCFMAYRLLGDISFMMMLKILVLLIYELKQVFITCYIGEMLIDSSQQIFNALYMQNWTVGSIAYRKQLRFMMLHTLNPLVLNVGGIANVSLKTLQLVLSMSYKMFAVLKST